MSGLLELAERCEAAEGADREIDLLIEAAINPEYDGLDEDLTRWLSKYGGYPRYTASLDAAMTLVPEGMEVALYWGTPGFKPNAQLENGEMRRRFEFEPHNGEAVTIALALCAAALRARASS